ncbi:MAG: dephospho-CoA kinase [Candidatus Brocadiia bacterium]|nr:dephospho-CoA kinase [Candidatus Brocadiia bacterium]
MAVIGLTGGIGSGKSAVSGLLQEMGATLIDADKVGHEAYLPHTEAWEEVVATFGPTVVNEDESINRPELGKIVFGDPEALAKLNAIMHPKMAVMIGNQIQGLKGQGVENIVLEAAILIEANWLPLVDQVWVVTAQEDEVVRRIQARNNFAEDAIRSRIRSQLSNEERVKHADAVIENVAGEDELRTEVTRLWHSRIDQG